MPRETILTTAIFCLLFYPGIFFQAARATCPPAGETVSHGSPVDVPPVDVPPVDGSPVDGSPVTEERIQALIVQLDADSFSLRERAHQKLHKIGKPAVRSLSAAATSGSRERADRARLLVQQIEDEYLYKIFAEFARRPDANLDVEEGMWLISCIADPNVEFQELTQQLDELATQVRKRLGELDPKTAEPSLVVAKIMEVIYDENAGFFGNLADYQNPNNSSLYHVLRTRKGLPIMLSHVVVSVAERLDIPIVGIGVPGRYMAKYDGSRAPEGTVKKDIMIDAFSGRLMTVSEVEKLINGFDPVLHTKPAGERLIIIRMLNNIAIHFHGVDDKRNSERALQFRALLTRYAQNRAELE